MTGAVAGLRVSGAARLQRRRRRTHCCDAADDDGRWLCRRWHRLRRDHRRPRACAGGCAAIRCAIRTAIAIDAVRRKRTVRLALSWTGPSALSSVLPLRRRPSPLRSDTASSPLPLPSAALRPAAALRMRRERWGASPHAMRSIAGASKRSAPLQKAKAQATRRTPTAQHWARRTAQRRTTRESKRVSAPANEAAFAQRSLLPSANCAYRSEQTSTSIDIQPACSWSVSPFIKIESEGRRGVRHGQGKKRSTRTSPRLTR
jgi:hypothetical protein